MVSAQSQEHELRLTFEKHGQGHVFAFWDELSPAERQQLLLQLGSLVACGGLELGAPFTQKSFEPLHESDISLEQAGWMELGREAIARGEVAVVTLAGGQGTRLGSSGPKGCFDLGLPSGSTPFRLQAERILCLGNSIPWLIMTSEATHSMTEAYFQQHDYFGLNRQLVRFFQQGSLAAFDLKGRILMEGKGRVFMAPDGNGGVFNALQRHGLLDWLASLGVKLINIVGIDNVLVRPADPVMIGWALAKNLDCGSKSVLRTDPTESVGLFLRQQGAIGVAEYSELSDDLRNAPRAQANIANHVVSLEFCRRVASVPLPRHRAHKQIPSIDTHGQSLKQAGIKLETFIFDAFLLAQSPGLLQVNRAHEFAPVKNAVGDCDTPATAREAINQLHRQWLQQAGVMVEGEGIVEISPLCSYAGEGLEGLKAIKAPFHVCK